MKIKEINRTLTIAWSHDVIPLLAAASVAGAVDLNFSSASSLEIWDPFGPQANSPVFAAHVDHKFHAVAWLAPFDAYLRGVLVAALETGVVEFYNVDTLIKTGSLQDATLHSSTIHKAGAKSLLFNALQPHILASGGLQGDIFIWDLKTFAEPFAPGRPMTPMDEISSLAWNNVQPHIMASTSNAGYTSIWDLKLKREVLHLSYNGPLGRADFSHVAWHPTQLTKLITASQSDLCPLIMLWDLRNASEPEKILQGHTKGVLSLDWCRQDANLLISSGKDNTTRLWNPTTGVKLGEYPSAANWAFSTLFAPRAPDVIATASFDAKIVIQTLQDTSPPVSEKVRSTNEDEFWSNIATAEVQQAVFEVQQAPEWLKRPCSASFGFGSKLVTVKNLQGKGVVQVSKFLSKNPANDVLAELQKAIKSNDFSEIVSARLSGSSSDKADWEVLLKLESLGKSQLFKSLVDEVEPELETSLEEPLDPENDDEFFSSLSKDVKAKKDSYVPTGDFKIIASAALGVESRLAKLLLNYKIPDAVSLCLEEGKLTEALILALDQSEAVKNKVKNQFFSQSGSDVTSRLIYSASSKDIADVVANADISDWRDIAASISSYCKDEEDFNHRMVELGDRVMQRDPSSKENRDNAFSCYLAGNALDKVSAIWLGDLPSLEQTLLHSEAERISSPLDARYLALSGFVEKLSVYRSISKLSGPLAGPSIEPVCKAIFEFSNMAASSGFFELADQFMAILPDDYAGVKTEKERIAKASGTTGSAEAAKKAPTNGHARTGRYSFGNKQATAAPRGMTRTPISSAPLGQGYTPANGPNLFVPGAAGAAQSHAPFNPYNPEKRPSFSGFQGNQAPVGVVRPPSTPAFTQPSGYAPPPSQMTEVLPVSVPPPPKKNETDGWNDLPDTFKAAKPAARRTPAPTSTLGLGVSHSPPKPVAPSPKPPISRLALGVHPPPPKSRVVTRGSNPGTPVVPAASSGKYTREPPSPAHSATGLISGSGFSAPKSAPKNPYAPTAVPSTKTTYAAPPVNNFVAPATANPVQNPYTPPPTSAASFGPRRPAHSRTISSLSQAQKGAPGPPLNRQTSQSFAPPPPVSRAAGSRRGSQSSAVQNRYAGSPVVPQSQLNGPPHTAVAPPPTGPPKTRAPSYASKPNQYAPSPSQNGDVNGLVGNGPNVPPSGNSPHVPPPQNGPTAPPKVNQYAPPTPQLNQQANQFASPKNLYAPGPPPPGPPVRTASIPPPVRAVNQGPPAGQPQAPFQAAPTNQYAPPASQAPPVSAPPVSQAPPVSAPPVSQAPPVSVPPVSAPPVSAPPVNAPLVNAPPVSAPPVNAPAANAPAVSAPPVSQPVSQPEAVPETTSDPSGSSVQTSFTAVLGRIKPEAPPKYAKHVADMEKRLGLLFGDLSSGKLSPAAVELLTKVASSLDSKDFASAAAFNQELSTNHAAEAGNWLTGVKRLVTMAEAFDS